MFHILKCLINDQKLFRIFNKIRFTPVHSVFVLIQYQQRFNKYKNRFPLIFRSALFHFNQEVRNHSQSCLLNESSMIWSIILEVKDRLRQPNKHRENKTHSPHTHCAQRIYKSVFVILHRGGNGSAVLSEGRRGRLYILLCTALQMCLIFPKRNGWIDWTESEQVVSLDCWSLR